MFRKMRHHIINFAVSPSGSATAYRLRRHTLAADSRELYRCIVIMEEQYGKEIAWWDTPCNPGMGFPRDCFGYSLIAVEVSHENIIVSITSRWNTYADDTDNFITEDEL